MSWQDEAERFINEPVVVCEITLDSGTRRLSIDWLRPENSAPYEGIILSLPKISNTLGDLNRTYEAGGAEIIIADPAREWREMAESNQLKNRALTIKLAFPNKDLADALTIFKGTIYSYKPVEGLKFQIIAQPEFANINDSYPDQKISIDDYPDAAEGVVGQIIPIIWSTVSSTDGPCRTFMVDTTQDAEKHLVGLQHWTYTAPPGDLVISNVKIGDVAKTEGVDYSIVHTAIGGKTHSVIAWKPGVRPTSADIITCDAAFTEMGPVEALKFFLLHWPGYEEADFDADSYDAAIAEEAARGYVFSGEMIDEATLGAWLDQIRNEFELDVWKDTATGKIKFLYLGQAVDFENAPHYKDYKDILQYTPNQDVELIMNWCKPGYNYDFARQNFKNYGFAENTHAQTEIGGVYRSYPSLFFIREEATADDLAARKVLRQKDAMALEPFVFPLKAMSYPLGTIFRITHFDGLGAGGYQGQYFQLRTAELELNSFFVEALLEDVSNFFGIDFIFGDEDTLADTWLLASEEDKYYGYLCDEGTDEFSNGDEGKNLGTQ